MKFTAEMHAPQRMQATFGKIVITGNGGYDTGYTDGYSAGHAAGHEDGYKQGEAAGYAEGEKHGADVTSSFYDDRISAELAEVNAIVEKHSDAKAETLEEVSETVGTAIGAASMKAQTLGYTQGVNITTAERNGLDEQRLADINAVITDYSGTPAENLDAADEAVRDTINKAETEAQALGYAKGTDDTNAKRDAEEAAEDAAFVADFNVKLGGYGTPVDTVEEIPDATSDALTEAYSKGETDGRAQEGNARDDLDEQRLASINNALLVYGGGFASSLEDVPEEIGTVADRNRSSAMYERDELDASRLADINTALTANGGTAADTLDNVDEKIPEVHAAGVQSEYDRFWDEFQQNGTRKNYAYGFCGAGWNDNTFKPKYDIRISTGYISANNVFTNTHLTDIEACLKACGVSLDVSLAGRLDNFCYYDRELVTFPEITIGDACTTIYYMFCECRNLVTIRKITFPNKSMNTKNAFYRCDSLENIETGGTIACDGLDFQWSTKLSRASIESIIATLSTTTSGLSITFSKEAVDKAFETSAGAADGTTSEAWKTLIGTKPNWTISLI